MKSTSYKPHWLDIAEMTAVTASIGGSITSIVLEQFLWATIPLSFSAGLAVVNHQRLKQLIKSEQEAVAFLVEENQTRITGLEQQSEKHHWDSKVEFKQLKQTQEKVSAVLERLDVEQKSQLDLTTKDLQTLQTSVTKLNELTDKLEQEQNATRKLTGELKAIEKFTQIINHNSDSVQPYFQRGLAYQRSGNIERAIEDFSQAISLCSDHAPAYYQRGLLYREIERHQEAILDFRHAAQYYVGKGDLDKYREGERSRSADTLSTVK